MSEVSKVLRGSITGNKNKEMENLMRSNNLKKGSLNSLGAAPMKKKSVKVLGGIPLSGCQCATACSCKKSSTAYPPRARAGLFDPRNFDQAWPEPSSNPLIPYNWGDTARDNEKKWLVPLPNQALSGRSLRGLQVDVKPGLAELFDSFKKPNEAFGTQNVKAVAVSVINRNDDTLYFDATLTSSFSPSDAFKIVSGTDSTTLGFVPVIFDGDSYLYVRFGGPEVISKIGSKGFTGVTTDFMGDSRQTTLNYQYDEGIEREYILSAETTFKTSPPGIRSAAKDEIGYVYPMRIKSRSVGETAVFEFFYQGKYRQLLNTEGDTRKEFIRYVLNKVFKLMEGLNYKGKSTIELTKNIMVKGRDNPSELATDLVEAFKALIEKDLRASMLQNAYILSTVANFPEEGTQRPYDALVFSFLTGGIKATTPISVRDINSSIERLVNGVSSSIKSGSEDIKVYSEAVAGMFKFYNDANPHETRQAISDPATTSTEVSTEVSEVSNKTETKKKTEDGFSGLQLAGLGLGVGALAALYMLSRPVENKDFN